MSTVCEWCHNPEGISFKTQEITKSNGIFLCGEKISSTELANRVLKNKDFFALHGGGVTLTGGEPTAQAPFVIDFLEQIQEIHSAIETSGYVSPGIFKEVISLVDLVLFNIKHTDGDLHRKYTGVSNRPILVNLKHLIDSGKEFIIRVPLIPDVNDTRENMLKILSLIKDAKSLIRVEILPYHKTASAKYQMIGKTYHPSFDTAKRPKIFNVFEENNIKTIIL